MLAKEAFSAVADAQGAVHEELQFAADGIPYGLDLIQRKLPFKHESLEPEGFKGSGLLRGAAYGLCGSVQFDGRKLLPEQTVVLHKDGVNAGFVEIPDKRSCLRQFLIAEQGVDRGIYPRAEAVGIFREDGNVRHGIPGGFPCSERRSCDIYGIGTAVYCCNADVLILGRSE